MSTIGKFLTRVRREKFAANITREIYHKIFPHMNGHADHGYPFSSNNELYKARLEGSTTVRTMLCDLGSAALKMPEAECNAFLYVANRDLEERLRMYIKLANARSALCGSEQPTPVAAAA